MHCGFISVTTEGIQSVMKSYSGLRGCVKDRPMRQQSMKKCLVFLLPYIHSHWCWCSFLQWPTGKAVVMTTASGNALHSLELIEVGCQHSRDCCPSVAKTTNSMGLSGSGGNRFNQHSATKMRFSWVCWRWSKAALGKASTGRSQRQNPSQRLTKPPAQDAAPDAKHTGRVPAELVKGTFFS